VRFFYVGADLPSVRTAFPAVEKVGPTHPHFAYARFSERKSLMRPARVAYDRDKGKNERSVPFEHMELILVFDV